jgi:hypothetical protein
MPLNIVTPTAYSGTRKFFCIIWIGESNPWPTRNPRLHGPYLQLNKKPYMPVWSVNARDGRK